MNNFMGKFHRNILIDKRSAMIKFSVDFSETPCIQMFLISLTGLVQCRRERPAEGARPLPLPVQGTDPRHQGQAHRWRPLRVHPQDRYSGTCIIKLQVLTKIICLLLSSVKKC